MTKAVHVPYSVKDEDGVWCAHAQLRPSVGAEEVVDDLREALAGLIAEFGVPDGLTVTVGVV